MQTEIEGQGEPWSGCIPLRQLAALSRLFNGETVAVKPTDSRVTIACEKSKHILPTFAAVEFPELDKIKDVVTVQVDGDTFRQSLASVLPCVSAEESRWAMQGVNCELSSGLIRLVATNGHRLGVTDIPVTNETEVASLIAAQGLSSLLKLDGNVTIKLSTNHAQFQCGNRTFTTCLLTGQFPNWQMIMPKDQPYSMEFDSGTLQAALKRVAVTRAETFKVGTGTILGAVRLDFHSDRLIVTTRANDKGEGEEQVSASSNLNGESVPLGLNPDYLSDFLSQVEGAATCQFKDGSTWPLFTHGNFRYVIATVRL